MSNNSIKKNVSETLKTITISFLIAMSARTSVAESRMIPSESMVPTLKVQDRLLIEKVSKYTSEIKRGDIVVFYPPYYQDKGLKTDITRLLSLPNETPLIKRVIGLPGEKIEIRGGKVYINEKELKENYPKEEIFYNMDTLTIPKNQVFVMGDNRNNSYDSHAWGTQPIEDIVGKAFIRFWPPNRIGLVD